jgi:large subunit ribosomal protein L29
MAVKARARRTEIQQMKDDVLKGEIAAMRTKLFDLHSQLVTAKVENTSEITMVRKDIARLLTERRRRQMAKAASKPALKPAKK